MLLQEQNGAKAEIDLHEMKAIESISLMCS